MRLRSAVRLADWFSLGMVFSIVEELAGDSRGGSTFSCKVFIAGDLGLDFGVGWGAEVCGYAGLGSLVCAKY